MIIWLKVNVLVCFCVCYNEFICFLEMLVKYFFLCDIVLGIGEIEVNNVIL